MRSPTVIPQASAQVDSLFNGHRPSELESFSSLLHSIYAASAEPARWHEAVGAIAAAMKAVQILLFTPYAGPTAGGFFYPWGIQERDLVLYGATYAQHDLWAHAAQRRGLIREGNIVIDHELVPQEELLASVYYREFLSPMGVARLCSGVVSDGAPGLPATVLSVYRGLDDEPFGPGDRELLRLLLPHLSRSLGLMHRLGAARHQTAAMRSALDRLTVGILLLKQDLGVAYVNSAAAQVLARGDGLSIDAENRLAGRGHAQGRALRLAQWLKEVVDTPVTSRGNFSDSFELARAAPRSTYSLQCCALESVDPLVGVNEARHIVFLTDPTALELPLASTLTSLLGLTPAEARVTLSLMKNGNYNEVAAELGVSAATVRSQTKAIYGKARVHNKASLTRVVLSLSKASV